MSMFLDTNERIQILLHEYDARSQEILNRTSHGFQLVVVAITAAVSLLVSLIGIWTSGGFSKVPWVLVALFLFLLGLFAAYGAQWTFHDIGKSAARIRDLEKIINDRAGEKLLVWETEQGGAVTGYVVPYITEIWPRAKRLWTSVRRKPS